MKGRGHLACRVNRCEKEARVEYGSVVTFQDSSFIICSICILENGGEGGRE